MEPAHNGDGIPCDYSDIPYRVTYHGFDRIEKRLHSARNPSPPLFLMCLLGRSAVLCLN